MVWELSGAALSRIIIALYGVISLRIEVKYTAGELGLKLACMSHGKLNVGIPQKIVLHRKPLSLFSSILDYKILVHPFN
jgi:hypothetical protein